MTRLQLYTSSANNGSHHYRSTLATKSYWNDQQSAKPSDTTASLKRFSVSSKASTDTPAAKSFTTLTCHHPLWSIPESDKDVWYCLYSSYLWLTEWRPVWTSPVVYNGPSTESLKILNLQTTLPLSCSQKQRDCMSNIVRNTWLEINMRKRKSMWVNTTLAESSHQLVTWSLNSRRD